MPIILPEQSVSTQFEEIVLSKYEMIRQNIFQNMELSKLRDWLLPMLINGQAYLQ
jgi:type I restriction enzyme S subunit